MWIIQRACETSSDWVFADVATLIKNSLVTVKVAHAHTVTHEDEDDGDGDDEDDGGGGG